MGYFDHLKPERAPLRAVPTTNAVASANDGRCATCARDGGLAP